MWIVKYVYNINAIRIEQKSCYVFPLFGSKHEYKI